MLLAVLPAIAILYLANEDMMYSCKHGAKQEVQDSGTQLRTGAMLT